jgi:hypothetical protein
MYAWETNSRYCFKPHSFILSIPYQHKVQPIINVVKYIPQFQRFEIYGSFSKAPTFPQIDEENRIQYGKEVCYNGVWRLEENDKMDLR